MRMFLHEFVVFTTTWNKINLMLLTTFEREKSCSAEQQSVKEEVIFR